MTTMGTQARKLPVYQSSNARTPYVPAARGDVSTLSERQRSLRAKFRVALVSMPFQWVRTPSIQIGLLSAVCESHGFPTETFHLTLEFAARVGMDVYHELSTVRSMVMGDWFFSKEAFRGDAPDQDARFLTDFAAEVAEQFGKDAAEAGSATLALRTRLAALRIRNEVVPAFLSSMMSEIDWSQYQVVGFSSVFQQTAASMALARRIKEAFPHVRIVFGGSNFDGEMGLEHIRATPWIDHAVIGEGDVALPELLVALSEDKPTDQIPGVASRHDGNIVFGGAQRLLEDLDQLPIPRYGEYFSRAESAGILPRTRARPTLPFESARGCWWGEKQHCTFCGLNGDSMRYRSKSPTRVASELAELARSYGTLNFTAVDNIVDTRYLKELFPQLVDEGKDYKFFYEIKANLTREQIKALRLAGVVEIQPGIESFSSHVLRLMRKGITGIQNVNTLRWATYYGLIAGWNMLWGFPGETAEDYAQQARLVQNLVHLLPPHATGVRIRMDRFSPLFKDREEFPVTFMRPAASYAYVYPATVDLTKIASFWDYQMTPGTTLDDSAYGALGAALSAWRAAWEAAGALARAAPIDGGRAPEGRKPTRHKPTLSMSYADDYLQIVDHRGMERVAHTFEGPLARLYKASVDRPVTAARAIELSGVTVPVKSVERALDGFCERRLMMRDGDKFLSLALPASQGR
jgi:ribosomal peptide maturation radical SAM protein 1